MAKNTTRVVVDTSGIKGFAKVWRDGLNSGNESNPVRQMLKQWAVRYLSFVQRRAQKQGRGGGWPALAQSTINGRRKGTVRKNLKKKDKSGKSVGLRGRGKPTILQDTGRLIGALEPGAAGSKIEQKRGAVVVGWAKTGHGDGLTFAKLGEIHNMGLGKVPQREILVKPDARTIKFMLNDAARAVKKTLRDNEIDED